MKIIIKKKYLKKKIKINPIFTYIKPNKKIKKNKNLNISIINYKKTYSIILLCIITKFSYSKPNLAF